jgi:hypothetical protein
LSVRDVLVVSIWKSLSGFFPLQWSSFPPCIWILHCFVGPLCRNLGIATWLEFPERKPQWSSIWWCRVLEHVALQTASNSPWDFCPFCLSPFSSAWVIGCVMMPMKFS